MGIRPKNAVALPDFRELAQVHLVTGPRALQKHNQNLEWLLLQSDLDSVLVQLA
jgi:hypothetical protein